jgi:hypothetical protein
VRAITGCFTRRRLRPPSGTWGDIKAIVVLGALLAVAVPEFVAGVELPPVAHRIALGLTLFYFGSR